MSRLPQRSAGNLAARPGSSVGAYWPVEESGPALEERPSTAPAVRDSYYVQQKQQQQWQPLEAGPLPPPERPATSYSERRIKASAQAMRAAILGEITERRCYDQARLRQLLKSYLVLNSGEAFYPTLQKVVASLREELGV